ncbi:MAG: hypothetical protein ACOCRK_10070 [bacterium]
MVIFLLILGGCDNSEVNEDNDRLIWDSFEEEFYTIKYPSQFNINTDVINNNNTFRLVITDPDSDFFFSIKRDENIMQRYDIHDFLDIENMVKSKVEEFKNNEFVTVSDYSQLRIGKKEGILNAYYIVYIEKGYGVEDDRGELIIYGTRESIDENRLFTINYSNIVSDDEDFQKILWGTIADEMINSFIQK